MIGGLAIALGAPAAAALPAALWCLRDSPVRGRWPLAAALAVGIGLGVSSLTFFAWLALGLAAAGVSLPAFELPLFALVGVGLAWSLRRRPWPAPAAPAGLSLPRGSRLAAVAIGLVVIGCALAAAVLGLRASPHGDFDAWAIWNLRARFLYRADLHSWRELFAASPEWTHPDYPLLLPALIARCWFYAGNDTTGAPRLVAAAFTSATAMLLCTGLASLRSPTQGLLAAAVLLGTSQFLSLGTAQYADVPLAYFLLAGVVLLAIADVGGNSRPVALAGMAGGLAAWTKNEGMLVLGALALVRAAPVLRGRDGGRARSHLAIAALGALPGLLALVYFKLAIAPPNDLLSRMSLAKFWGRISDWERYALIITFAARQLALTGPGTAFVLAGYLLLMGRRPHDGRGFSVAPAFAVLALVLVGYFLVYLTTYWMLKSHLMYSLDRLALHVYPAALFAFFLFAATPEEALGHARTAPQGADALRSGLNPQRADAPRSEPA